jgi:hypothetical protein
MNKFEWIPFDWNRPDGDRPHEEPEGGPPFPIIQMASRGECRESKIEHPLGALT